MTIFVIVVSSISSQSHINHWTHFAT